MKRLSKNARQRLERISRKIRRLSNKALIEKRRHRKARAQKKSDSQQSYPAKRIIAPVRFSIESNETRGPLMKFLADLRRSFVNNDIRAITIDLARTTSFVSSATLLFYAELSRLIEITNNRIRVRCKPPTNDRACQVLHQIGIYSMCNQQIKMKPVKYDDVVHWRAARGHVVDNSICAPAIEAFEGQLALPLVNGIFRGLGEAMTNAIHHAYIDIRSDGLDFSPPHKNWWMFSQARTGYLSVVFCDLGIGIPNTLPIKKPNLFKRIFAMGRAGSDGACIEDAIEDSRTRTQQPERGRGLGNIVNVVSELKGGVVMVLSNRGFYLSQNGSTPKTYDLKDSILGTLIYWRVPLVGESNHGE